MLVFVKPDPGLLVRNPDRRDKYYFNEAGENVELTTQIQRLIRFGDLVVIAPNAPVVQPTPKTEG